MFANEFKPYSMKKIVLTSIVIFTLLTSKAQNFQGKAFYQTKRSFSMKLDSTQVYDDLQKQLQEMIRKQFEKIFILSFNKNESVYKQQEKLEKPKPSTSGIIVEIGGASDVLYKNTKEKTYTKSEENFGKKFLIKDSLQPLVWELTNESKKIGNYQCMKAKSIKLIDDYDDDHNKKENQKEVKIVAWYTPEIPISNGPDFFGGLPGLILELHEGKMNYVCNKIVMNPSKKVDIKAPKKGKKMNQKEYDKLMDKKQKEIIKQFKSTRKKGKKGDTFTISIGG